MTILTKAEREAIRARRHATPLVPDLLDTLDADDELIRKLISALELATALAKVRP